MTQEHCSKPWRDEQPLRELYWDRELSQDEVAEELGTTQQIVSNWMQRLGVETRGSDVPELHDENCLNQRYEEEQPWRDKDKLHQKYHEEKMTQGEMAELWGCTKSCISRWMSRHGVETDRGLVEELRDAGWLHEQYVERGNSAMEIAEALGCSETAVFYWLEKHGIETRTSPHEQLLRPTTGPRGYERLHTSGYEGKDKIKLHRLVAIAEYGLERVLENEVHHKNGIPWDNRPSNLELRSHADHARVHAQNRDRDAKGRFVN